MSFGLDFVELPTQPAGLRVGGVACNGAGDTLYIVGNNTSGLYKYTATTGDYSLIYPLDTLPDDVINVACSADNIESVIEVADNIDDVTGVFDAADRAEAASESSEEFSQVAQAAAAQMTAIELINSTTIYPTGTVLTLSGYSSPGDGGGAQWKFTGVTGQTPSQSPADLGDALINDASGNQWDMVTVPTIVVSEFPTTPLVNTLYIKEAT